MRVKIKNWDEFQHYKQRNPPWVKLYNDMVRGETWVSSSDKDRLIMLVSLMVGSMGKNHGEIPSEEYMQRVAYMTKRPDFQPLVESGWFEKIDDDSEMHTNASSAQADASASVSVSASVSASSLYGEFENVRLTKEEYSKLCDRHGEDSTIAAIDELGAWLKRTGKKRKDHYACMNASSWVWEKVGASGPRSEPDEYTSIFD